MPKFLSGPLLKDHTDNISPGSSAKFVPPCFPDSGVGFGDQVQPRWKTAALASCVSAQVSSPLHFLHRWSLQTEGKFSSSYCLTFSFLSTPSIFTNFQCRDVLQGHFKPPTARFSLFLLQLLPTLYLLTTKLPSFRVRFRLRVWVCTLWITQWPHPCGEKLENSAPSDIKPQESPEGR